MSGNSVIIFLWLDQEMLLRIGMRLVVLGTVLGVIFCHPLAHLIDPCMNNNIRMWVTTIVMV